MTDELLTPMREKALQLRVEGRYKELIEHCDVLLEKGLTRQDHKAVLCAHIHHAAAFYSIGAIEEAFLSVDAHLQYCSQYGDENEQLNGINILVILYDYNKDYTKAKSALMRGIEMGTRLKRWNMVSNAYSNYSHICASEKEFEGALEAGLIGLEMAERYNPDSAILSFRVKLNIANAYVGLGDTDRAGQMIEQMLADPLLDTHKREKTHCYDLYGRYLVKTREYASAMKAFDVAKKEALDINDLLLLKEIQERRCDLCEILDDRQLGFVVQQEYIKLLKMLQQQELAKTALKLEMKHNVAAIERNAKTDFLTRLFNRRHLEETAASWLAKATEAGSPISCVALDLDNFKSINDTYGHLAGDEALRVICTICRTVLWKSDSTELLARYGGDELVFLLNGASRADAADRVHHLLAEIQKQGITYNDELIPVTVSIGIADNSNGLFTRFSELFYRADQALYQSKANGKNQLTVYESPVLQ
ncbi:GGDEF domain-containing protein [Sporosarcina gallistercoris]|uniref:GGDEF domain-containing protein n=1 Tax=Sporosarcina gallistercoris TaxID=2762245 RepID=A0ABR8PMI5_9BACL|nr:GGDEF domain-containing protein [Sporosarcina gallistercoris]MBD7909372.1 GGDEF domain-containing protein [Sporosarcina gallistercoris]